MLDNDNDVTSLCIYYTELFTVIFKAHSFLLRDSQLLGVMVHTYSPSTQEAETGGSKGQRQSGLCSKTLSQTNTYINKIPPFNSCPSTPAATFIPPMLPRLFFVYYLCGMPWMCVLGEVGLLFRSVNACECAGGHAEVGCLFLSLVTLLRQGLLRNGEFTVSARLAGWPDLSRPVCLCPETLGPQA